MPAEPLVATLQSQVKGKVMAPGVEGYADKLARWALNFAKPFRFAVLAENVDDIVTAVKFANERNIPLTTYGGGHSLAGGSSTDTGLVVDLRMMHKVRVDTEKRLLYVQGGALWADVDIASQKYGLATVAGTVSHTGVGGLTLYGGYGWLSGRYGLTLDNVVGATIVTADGNVLTVSEKENADLYWAIRGGGANFGIVAEFVLQAYPQQSTVWGGSLLYSEAQIPEFVKTLNGWLQTRGVDEAGFVVVRRFPEVMADFVPTGGVSVKDSSVIFFVTFYNGSAQEGKAKFAPFYNIKPLADLTTEMRYMELNSSLNAGAPHGLRRNFSPFAFRKLDESTLRSVVDRFNAFFSDPQHKDAEENSAVMFEFLHADKIASVPPTATAFPFREVAYNGAAAFTYLSAGLEGDVKQVANDIAGLGQDREFKYVYPNYGDGSHPSEDIYGVNYEKLKTIKAKYDPKNRFQGPYPIISA